MDGKKRKKREQSGEEVRRDSRPLFFLSLFSNRDSHCRLFFADGEPAPAAPEAPFLVVVVVVVVVAVVAVLDFPAAGLLTVFLFRVV